MARPLLPEWTSVERPVVGMLHLAALPGSPGYGGQLEPVRTAVLKDAEALVNGGVNGLLLENFGDVPFYPDKVPAATVAHLTAMAAAVRRRFDVPLGVNVLRNDGMASLAVAHAAGAHFIRVNILQGARLTDQGIIQGIAHELLRERARLGAAPIKILADVNVKHSAPLGPYQIIEEVHDLVDRGGADGLVVSGVGTGKPARLQELEAVKTAAGETPVFVGSGVTLANHVEYLAHCDGFIIGTAFKFDGVISKPVDTARVLSLMARLKR
jgi:membrane complex biogenesis BtpA family protein